MKEDQSSYFVAESEVVCVRTRPDMRDRSTFNAEVEVEIRTRLFFTYPGSEREYETRYHTIVSKYRELEVGDVPLTYAAEAASAE